MICPEHLYWSWLPDPYLVQYFSLPLILLGVLLALVEVRYPLLTGRFEQSIRESEHRLRNSDVYTSLVGFLNGGWTSDARLGGLFLVTLTGGLQFLYYIIMIDHVAELLVTWVVITLLGFLGLQRIGSSDVQVRVLSMSAIMGACIQIAVAYAVGLALSRVAVRVLAFFDRTGGRIVGRIGVTVAVLGLSAELYQTWRLTRMEYWAVIVLTLAVLGLGAFSMSRLMKRAAVRAAAAVRTID